MIICRRNEAEKSSGEIDSNTMRNWKAGMMQRIGEIQKTGLPECERCGISGKEV